MARVTAGQEVRLTSLREGAGQEVVGNVRLITKRVNPDTRLVDVFVKIPSDSGLMLEGFVRGELAVDSELALVVPREAALPADNGWAMYTVENGKAVQHAVTVGLEDDKQVEVVGEGLKEGAAVVVEGNYELTDGMAVDARQAEDATTPPATAPAGEPATPAARAAGPRPRPRRLPRRRRRLPRRRRRLPRRCRRPPCRRRPTPRPRRPPVPPRGGRLEDRRLGARHARSIIFLLFVLAAAGAVSAFRVPVALFPQVSFPRVRVSLDAGDRPAERMAVEVTYPVEEALRAIPGVRSVRSTTSRGSAEIDINFDWGQDMVAALLQAESQINRMLPSLPPGTTFDVQRMDPTVFPVIAYSLTSDTHSLTELRDLATYELRPALSTVDGVAKVDVQGGAVEEYRVVVDPAQAAVLRPDPHRRGRPAVGVQRPDRRRPPGGPRQALPGRLRHALRRRRSRSAGPSCDRAPTASCG